MREERCNWSMRGELCGEPSLGHGIRCAVSYAPIPPEDRWLALCELHTRRLALGFTIMTNGGTLAVPPTNHR
jgi:hypothetical protein